jgi:acyl-CoA thioester hydrolase
MFTNTIEFRVEWGECDSAGIIFYPNYYRWFDRATHQMFRIAGIPIYQLMTQHGFAHPILESGCRFSTPLYYDDLVQLETVVTEVRNKTFRLEHTVRRGDTITGAGFEVRAWVKQDDKAAGGRMAAVPIPAEYLAILKGENI